MANLENNRYERYELPSERIDRLATDVCNVPELIQLTHHRESAVRSQAIDAISALGAELPEADIRRLIHDRSWIVRVSLTEALSHWPAVGKENLLILLNDREPLVRGYAAESLASFPSSDTRDELERRLKDDRSCKARIGLALSLYKITGNLTYIDIIIQCTSSRSNSIRENAINALRVLVDGNNAAILSHPILSLLHNEWEMSVLDATGRTASYMSPWVPGIGVAIERRLQNLSVAPELTDSISFKALKESLRWNAARAYSRAGDTANALRLMNVRPFEIDFFSRDLEASGGVEAKIQAWKEAAIQDDRKRGRPQGVN